MEMILSRPGMAVALLFTWTVMVVAVTYWLTRRSVSRTQTVLAYCDYCQFPIPAAVCQVKSPAHGSLGAGT